MVSKLLIFACLFAAPLSAQNAHVRWSAVASYAASEFDASTTYAALHGCECREMNPLLRPFAGNATAGWWGGTIFTFK